MTKNSKPEYKSYKYIVPEGTPEKIEYCSSVSYYKKPEVDFFKYAYILDTITRHTSTYLLQGKDYNNYDGCPLHLKTLASILGTGENIASQFLKNLIAQQIIKRVGGYTKGIKSYHYTLA